MSIVDRALDNWDSKRIARQWDETDVYIKDHNDKVITDGTDFQAQSKVYRTQIHTITGDVFFSQGPALGFLTSLSFLTAAIPFRLITCGGNVIHAGCHGLSAVNTIWNKFGDTHFSTGQVLAKPGKHLWHAFKDLCVLYVANSVYKSSPTPFGLHLIHYLALTTFFACAAYNPLETRVWANNKIARWDIRPVSEATLVTMNLKQKVWAILDGSYSLLRLLGIERIGNKDLDKATIEIA